MRCLGVVVDPDDAEPAVVAPGPLEVVQQRPQEVAAHVDPGVDGLADRVDVAVQVGHPVGVVHLPVVADVVVEGGPVLGDHQRQVRVPPADVGQQLEHAGRIDVPAHRRVRAGLLEELDVVGAHPRADAAVAVPVRLLLGAVAGVQRWPGTSSSS